MGCLLFVLIKDYRCIFLWLLITCIVFYNNKQPTTNNQQPTTNNYLLSSDSFISDMARSI
ncbi:MAG TPA: hypothetical protein DCP31_19055 [Cyanobacteria bacterium UBA8543]|nr:hypothetical protein [Cyanobacteria bacterium UBA8543]